jgi:Protein of unknown function (DUF3320)
MNYLGELGNLVASIPSTFWAAVNVVSEPVFSAPYVEASFAVSTRHDIHQVSVEYLAGIIRRIIEIEGPIHGDEIVTRVRTLWGKKRAAGRIRPAVHGGLRMAARDSGVTHEGSFYLITGAPVKVRDRSQSMSPSLRRPEMLPPLELRMALLVVVEQNLGADRDEAITLVSRAVGFKATSAQLRQLIEQQIDSLIESGDLLEVDRRLSRPVRQSGV